VVILSELVAAAQGRKHTKIKTNDVDEDASDICGICAEKEKRFNIINSKFDQ
jgi:hypothetical protein